MKEAFREAFIRHVRVYDVSIAEVARQTGVSKYLLNALHQRKTQVPNVADAIKIARFFGKTVDEFLDQDAPKNNDAMLASKIARLSPEERRVFEVQVDALLRHRSSD